MKTFIKKLLAAIGRNFYRESVAQIALHQEIARLKAEIRACMPENLVLEGYKIYSQVDEDGILQEIFKRIGDGGKTFIEIGCGDGSENNTHALILKGWSGIWVDGNKANIERIKKHVPSTYAGLSLIDQMITRENVVQVLTEGMCSAMHELSVDFLSVDIDGNDYYVLEELLKHSKPRVICVEYNAKFPYPMEVKVEYSPFRRWEEDDYQGSSLACFIKLLSQFGYTLITCNLAGTNAFFVNDLESQNFMVYSHQALYRPARYDLIEIKNGHPASGKFLRDHCRSV